MKRLVLIAVLLAVAFGCSKKTEKAAAKDAYVYEPIRIASVYIPLLERPYAKRALLIGDDAKAHSNYLARAGVLCYTTRKGKFDLILVTCGSMTKKSCGNLCESLAEGGVVTWIMDVEDVTVETMLERFQGFALDDVHLWMPGEHRWLLVGRKTKAKVRLSEMMDVFVRERAFGDLAKMRCGTIPEMFANYVGDANDVVPAFYHLDRKAKICPELFVPKDVPKMDWLDAADLDEDIRKKVLAEVRSLQLMRRQAIEGGIAATKAKDKKSEEDAAGLLARAAVRNPNDLFILERLDRLDRNARGFLSVGKLLLAMKCYETMVLISPNDAVAVHNFGMCLKKLGKLDLAEKILSRAESLANGKVNNAKEPAGAKPSDPANQAAGK